ncbi:MAG TPA: YbaB/EbfC family nucleoid-associated protein [Bryobacteraceae bacterium]|jgi:DNA-binding YbaB/EbfC family protein|nr:YbaB/EbfC family nucleoid-associated protein [Bryobacteraceae bacterium]
MKLPGNMQAMMKQAEQMQKKLQEEIALIKVEATAGGGMVTVNMDGKKNVTGVKIDPEVAGDVEMLQDMMMAAFNEASKKVDDQTQQKMGGLLGGLGLPPGMF